MLYKELAPIGTVGELYIGGDGLARCYHRRPELTAEQFKRGLIPDRPEVRLYKTGDMVRRLADSTLEFIGRLDRQIKLRGFRIELAEIEEALLGHPDVTETVVSIHEDAPGDKRLVAYLVTQRQPLTVTEVRKFLIGTLPDYMLPSAIVLLEAFPLTPNGKIDRSALPPPDMTRPPRSKTFVAPRTAQEVTMSDIWASVLHLGQVGITDDLFELGADSLHIFQIAARANKVGINVPPALLLKHRSIADLIRQIDNEPGFIASTDLPEITKVARDKYRIERSSMINAFERKNGSA